MSQTIHGTYRNGTVSLDHLPEGVTEARVIVDFMDQQSEGRPRGALRFGMFAKSDVPFTSDEDIDAVKKAWNQRNHE